jgi:two-component system response regulator AtoC
MREPRGSSYPSGSGCAAGRWSPSRDTSPSSRRTLPAADAPAEPEICLRLDQPLPAAVDALEQSFVRHALERSHGRVEEAARILGISRKGLFLKRRRWGLKQAS